MEKIKLTKGALKRERDKLRQFEHYLPILQLKKQQLQLEIQRTRQKLELKIEEIDNLENEINEWSGLLNEDKGFLSRWVKPKNIFTKAFNITGINIAIFDSIEFESLEYDLFFTPLWVDGAIDSIRKMSTLIEEEKLLKQALGVLGEELRITTQRVNLFEKVKMPECRENIRVIRIYLGDQQANAVGRSKIAKNKLQNLTMEEVYA